MNDELDVVSGIFGPPVRRALRVVAGVRGLRPSHGFPPGSARTPTTSGPRLGETCGPAWDAVDRDA